MVDIKCIINGKDISDKIKEHMISLAIVDNEGTQADTLDMSISNYIKRPKGEDTIKIWIDNKFYGTHIVNETTTNDENVLLISATSVNFHRTLKEKRNEGHGTTSLHKLIKKIAKRHGLKTKIDFDDISYSNLIQDKESDLHMLKQLADKYDAIFAIKNNTIIFRKRAQNVPTFTIDLNDCKPWSITHVARKKYKSASAIWRDTKANKTQSSTHGSGEPKLIVSGDFASREDALQTAKGALSRTQRQTRKGTLTKAGEYLSAGSILKIVGSKQDDGEYTISAVTTVVDRNSGFTVHVSFSN